MVKIGANDINRYIGMVDSFLKPRYIKREDIKTGIDAWMVAHRAGITSDAYKNKDIYDSHIQTALEKIFKNVVFKDKKRY